MKAERVDMAKIRSDIGNAFLLAKRFYERREDTKCLVLMDAAENRVAGFLCGVDANNACHKAATALLPVLRKLCDWDDGCLYVNGTACPELAEPMRLLEAAIAKTTN